MGAASNVGSGLLVEQLARQLGAAFSTPGCVNIRELHTLLSSLIELHVRYDGAAAKQLSSEAPSGTSAVIEETNLERTTSGTSAKSNHPETVPQPEAVASAGKISDTDPVTTVSKDSSSAVVEEPTISTQANERHDGVEPQPADGNDSEKAAASRTSSIGYSPAILPPRESVEDCELSPRQRSSDFLVKSTTTSKGSFGQTSQESSFGPKGSRPIIQTGTPKCSTASVRSTTHSSSTGSTSVHSQTYLKDGAIQTDHDFVAILEGCRTHLEAVKDEVLAVKARCESQHEDNLKLADGLDNLVERIGAQEPKLSKLETDTHCLGMLVSDYEVNFGRIEKHLERHDVRLREFEWALQRVDKERDALRADLRAVTEQVNYLSTVKADKVDVQTEMGRRALVTDMRQRVPYDVFNEMAREVSHTVTQLREDLHDVENNLKTVQYELVKGLGAKASAQDVSEIRKQVVGALHRWKKLEQVQPTTAMVVSGDFPSAAVASSGMTNVGTEGANCLTCGIQTTLKGSRSVVPLPAKFVPMTKMRHLARNAGGFHTKFSAPEKVFRSGSLGMVKKVPKDEKRTEQSWKF